MKTSKYWGVCYDGPNGKHDRHRSIAERLPWKVQIHMPNKKITKCFPTEREAAIYADRINLEHRLGKPLNILKPRP